MLERMWHVRVTCHMRVTWVSVGRPCRQRSVSFITVRLSRSSNVPSCRCRRENVQIQQESGLLQPYVFSLHTDVLLTAWLWTGASYSPLSQTAFSHTEAVAAEQTIPEHSHRQTLPGQRRRWGWTSADRRPEKKHQTLDYFQRLF